VDAEIRPAMRIALFRRQAATAIPKNVPGNRRCPSQVEPALSSESGGLVRGTVTNI
jgi:hypothetical protein